MTEIKIEPKEPLERCNKILSLRTQNEYVVVFIFTRKTTRRKGNVMKNTEFQKLDDLVEEIRRLLGEMKGVDYENETDTGKLQKRSTGKKGA